MWKQSSPASEKSGNRSHNEVGTPISTIISRVAASHSGRTALTARCAFIPATVGTALAAEFASISAIGTAFAAWCTSIPTTIGIEFITGVAAYRSSGTIVTAEFTSIPAAVGANLIAGVAAYRSSGAIRAELAPTDRAASFAFQTTRTTNRAVYISISTRMARRASAARHVILQPNLPVSAATAAEWLSCMARCYWSPPAT